MLRFILTFMLCMACASAQSPFPAAGTAEGGGVAARDNGLIWSMLFAVPFGSALFSMGKMSCNIRKLVGS